MLQRFLIGIGAINLLAVIVLYAYVLRTDHKVVYVDSAKLLNNYKGMINAKAAYKLKASGWKANIDTLTTQVQRQIVAYEKDSPKMSSKERQLSQELIRTRQKQLYDYQQAINSQASEEDAKMSSDVLVQVNAYIKKFGESHGYKIILASTDYGNLAYAQEDLDITDKILEGLNNEYQVK